jgi:type VI secretion system protein ImpF
MDQEAIPRLSVLDRLLDEEPQRPQDPPMSHRQALGAMRRAVGRDLENLLNTRIRCKSSPADLKELDVSLVNYGVPDFTGANLATSERRNDFRAAVEQVIRRYEPRFTAVSVTILENTERLDRTLRFRIEALMRADPDAEPVVYDSVVDPVSRNVTVKGGNG